MGYSQVKREQGLDSNGGGGSAKLTRTGIVMFPEEKLRYEVAAMRYIEKHTTIRVPKIYHFGTGAENPTGLGPFVIMEYIHHESTLSAVLNDPNQAIGERHRLDPNVSEEKLHKLYSQMANILLQLSTLKFSRIGSLVEEEEDVFSVSSKPLTDNMNALVEHTDMPPGLLPSQSYATSKEWYSAMADMHLAQLTFQHNDAVMDEDDARDKYVARQLFRQLASDGRLTSYMRRDEESEAQPSFLMYNPDFRPSNVLIDKDLNVVAFSYDPPWWLLLRRPEEYDGGFEPWMEAYAPVLDTFLRIMEEEEKKMQAASEKGNLDKGLENLTLSDEGTADRIMKTPLSQRMRESWERKTWIINYAARGSWEFDWLYWRFIDHMFFGPNEDEDHHARLDLLSRKQREVMEPFVKMKMEEDENCISVEWEEEAAAAHLARFLV
ncbi:phosphotransferase family protein [Xylariaceae sp. FL0594]|nr:phosphotransferase family protein [Xylariaceae sp. FL0594]